MGWYRRWCWCGLEQHGQPRILPSPLHKQLNERAGLQPDRQRRINELAAECKLRRAVRAATDDARLDHLPRAKRLCQRLRCALRGWLSSIGLY